MRVYSSNSLIGPEKDSTRPWNIEVWDGLHFGIFSYVLKGETYLLASEVRTEGKKQEYRPKP